MHTKQNYIPFPFIPNLNVPLNGVNGISEIVVNNYTHLTYSIAANAPIQFNSNQF